MTASAFLAASLLSASAGGATPLTNPLTAEEVACNERQLANLLERSIQRSQVEQSCPGAA